MTLRLILIAEPKCWSLEHPSTFGRDRGQCYVLVGKLRYLRLPFPLRLDHLRSVGSFEQ